MPGKAYHQFPYTREVSVEDILPDTYTHIYTEGPGGVLNRSLILRCPPDDQHIIVFEHPEPATISAERGDRAVLEGACNSDNYLLTIPNDGLQSFEMVDVDEGPFQLIIKHIGRTAFN